MLNMWSSGVVAPSLTMCYQIYLHFCPGIGIVNGMGYTGIALGLTSAESSLSPRSGVNKIRLRTVPDYMLVKLDDHTCLQGIPLTVVTGSGLHVELPLGVVPIFPTVSRPFKIDTGKTSPDMVAKGLLAETYKIVRYGYV